MDSVMLADMLESIQAEDHAIDSVTVIRHGHIVADAAIAPYRAGTKHQVHSCTKSIVSALVGIAIEQGYIEGVDQKLLDLFPDRSAANLDSPKQAMTLEHLLTMSTGLECRDSYLYRWQGLREMERSEDWIQYMLDLPMAHQPGTKFEYCNGASFLLSAIIQEKIGLTALEFATKHLFGPLGIHDVDWPTNPQGISLGWGGLRMTPHDMARIGHLYLKQGEWGGEQIVPAEWVIASTRKQIPGTLQDGYGYQWWVDQGGTGGGDSYMALGYGGQYIIVVPGDELVVVFASHLEEEDFYVPQRLLTEHILPSIRSDAPLPANAEGVTLLQARVDALASP